MERKSIHFEIVAPDRQLFIGEVESLIMPSMDGLIGVEPGHEPMVTAIEPGDLKYKVNGEWQTAVVSQGFAEVCRIMLCYWFPPPNALKKST